MTVPSVPVSNMPSQYSASAVRSVCLLSPMPACSVPSPDKGNYERKSDNECQP